MWELKRNVSDHSQVLVDSKRIDQPWSLWAREKLTQERYRYGKSPLYRYALPVEWDVDLYIKDESVYPGKGLNYRVIYEYFYETVCCNLLESDMTIIAIGTDVQLVVAAHFAHLLELQFVAILPPGVSSLTISQITRYGGGYHIVSQAHRVVEEAHQVSKITKGTVMNCGQIQQLVWGSPYTLISETISQLGEKTFNCDINYIGEIVLPVGYKQLVKTSRRQLRDSENLTMVSQAELGGSFRLISDTYEGRDFVVSPSAAFAAQKIMNESGYETDTLSGAVVWAAFHSVAQMHNSSKTGQVVAVVQNCLSEENPEPGSAPNTSSEVKRHKQTLEQWIETGRWVCP